MYGPLGAMSCDDCRLPPVSEHHWQQVGRVLEDQPGVSRLSASTLMAAMAMPRCRDWLIMDAGVGGY